MCDFIWIMNESSRFEKRYDFNMAQINPVGESSHLNGKHLNSTSMKSTVCVNNKHGYSDSNNKSIVNLKNRSMKIDARIAADVQSKGLASRIVKYHETGAMLCRSMSAHNLYSKPGQFPAVTFKKSKLPYRATKQELSMIKIQPPEKSSFYGNTISGLLRSSSVIGLQSKRNEDFSRENRPIIHPPPSENEMAPTRSVLDVLKEISRKRINSDNLESEETSKKYCNRVGNDFVDTTNNTTSSFPPNFIPSSLSYQRYKRQRDCITPHLNVQLSEIKTSPEQAKKRVCNYNNDIISSLSSSVKCKGIMSPRTQCQTLPANTEPCEIPKSKIQSYLDHHKNQNNEQVDKRFENLETTLNKVDLIHPITPIPATPLAQDQTQTCSVSPRQTVSESFYNSDRKITELKIPPNKPRLTLFNKTCDEGETLEANESYQLMSEKSDFNSMDDCTGVHFVKPKKMTSKRCLRNPILERTQKSKLELMLSGLRGELYQNSEVDELDSTKETKSNTNTVTTTCAVKSTDSITSLTTATCTANVKTTNTITCSPIEKNNASSPSLTTNAAHKKSPLVGIKLSQPNPLIASDGIKITNSQIKPVVPVLPNFSFSTTSSTSTSVVTTFSNVITNCETTTVPTKTGKIFNFGQTNKVGSLVPSNDKTNDLVASNQNSTKENLTIVPSSGTPSAVLPSNITSSSNVASSLAPREGFSFALNWKPPITTSSASTPATTDKKLSNAFNFNTPTSATTNTTVPQLLGTLTSPANVTTIRTPTFATAVTSVNLGVTSTPLFTFNSTPKTTPNETTTIPSLFSNMVANSTVTSAPTLATSTSIAINTQSPNSAFSTASDVKFTHLLPSGQEISKPIGKIPFTSNTPTSPSLNTTNPALDSCTPFKNAVNSSETKQDYSSNTAFKSNNTTSFSPSSVNQNAQENSVPAFGNDTNTSENTTFSSLKTKPIFDSSSFKVATETFASTNSNKTTTPTAFTFRLNPNATTNATTNSTTTTSGGFSFTSAVSNTGSFQFLTKSKEQINNGVVTSAPSSESKSFTFNLSATKSATTPNIFGVVNTQTENDAQGFSLRSAASTKPKTFTFEAVNNSCADSVTSENSVSSGFAFAQSSVPKPNESSNNKPFSFGLSQPAQQKQMQPIVTTNANSNIFGLNESPTIAQPPTFNFNSTNSANTTSNNIFAPSSNITTGPGDRLIRRATRRLQKSPADAV